MRHLNPTAPLALAMSLMAGSLGAASSAGATPPAIMSPRAAAVRPAPPAPPVFTAPEYVMGAPRAKITVTEYASVACPHCARFDAEVWPAFKAKYVDTGKVRFAYREMLVGDEAMVQVAAAGFMLARCAGQAHYFDVVEAIYRAQPEIFSSGDLKGVLTRIATANGLTPERMQACLDDKANLDALNARQKLADADHITGTPTLLVNGKILEEHGKEPDLALLDGALQPLLANRRR